MLMPIQDLEFIEGKKLCVKSELVSTGIAQLRKKRLVSSEEFENVIELPELLLEIYLVAQSKDKRHGNINSQGK